MSDNTSSEEGFSSDASKDSAESRERRERKQPFTKVVIRRLPPTMSEEAFLDQIAPVPKNNFFYFMSADWSLGKEAFCRAYINFSNPDDVFLFKEKFDNYVFLDSKGFEYPAVVEYAPYEKVPEQRNQKKDPKCGTIESDPTYIEFLKSLKEGSKVTKQENKVGFNYQFKTAEKKIRTTPLLEFIAARNIEKQRIKDERKADRRKKYLKRRKQRDEDRRTWDIDQDVMNIIVEEGTNSACFLDDDMYSPTSIPCEPNMLDSRYDLAASLHYGREEGACGVLYIPDERTAREFEVNDKITGFSKHLEAVHITENKYEVKKYSRTRQDLQARRIGQRQTDARRRELVECKLHAKTENKTLSEESILNIRKDFNDNIDFKRIKNLNEPFAYKILPSTDELKKFGSSSHMNTRHLEYSQDVTNDGDYKKEEMQFGFISRYRRNSFNSGDSKKINEDFKQNRDAKKEPQVERIMQQKDRPSVDLHQPGKDHLSSQKDKPVVGNTKPRKFIQKNSKEN